MPERPPAARSAGRRLVEPPGYFVASFLSAAGLVGGIGLAPDGLLLFAAAFILSVIEWRRLRAANPWLKLETPEDYRTPEGRLFMRYSAMGTGINVALAIAAVVLVQTEDRDAAVIGPALIGGVATIAINYLLKLGVARLGTESAADDRPGGFHDDDDDEGAVGSGHGDDDHDEPGFAGHAPPLEQPRKGRREAKPSREPRAPKAPKVPRTPQTRPTGSDDAPIAPPHETAPHDGDPDDGFVEQDDRALNGPRIEPPHRSKSRRGRADKDDRRY